MQKNLNKLIRMLVFILALSLLGACGKKDETESEDADKENTVQEEEQEVDTEETIELTNLNLLTGLNDLTDEAVGKRPVAVMVNNVKAALPQYGISEADVIFDIVVEGDQTRLMAVYADYTQVPYICSVRSCRYYYAALAKGFDAYYIHWGQDMEILDYLNSLGLDKFDGMSNEGGLFGRNQDRLNSGYVLEHTGDFDGEKLVAAIEKKKMRTELLEGKQGTAFKFNKYGRVVQPEGDACSEVFIDFGAQNATLKYNADTNTYFKEFNGEAHMDASTDTQLEFTNVFVLETAIKVRDSAGYKTLDWKGGEDSTGYYVSNGAVQKIHWMKDSESDYLKFYDENGEELSINRGKSYIAINYKNQTKFN